MTSRFWLASAALVWLGSGAPAFAAFDSAEAAKQKDLRILKVTPSGEDVPAGRQIVITFNRPVVPIGKMERKKEELPITIAPDLSCQWRWINTSSLACELDEKTTLSPATKYDIEIKPGIRSEDGATIAEDYKSSFITERPDTRYAWFRTWKSPSFPVVRVTFNQSVSKESVEEHLFFSYADGSGRHPAHAEPDPDDRELPNIIPVPGTKGALFGAALRQKSDDEVRREGGIESRRVWLLTPDKPLNLDSTYTLKVDPGLRSALGPERGIGNRVVVQFDTFPEFSFIGVKCVSNAGKEILITPNQKSGDLCDPLARVALAFSSPVLRSHVKKQFNFTPDLAGGRKDFDPWGNTEENEYSRLTSPHKKGNDYEVWLPGGLKAAQSYVAATKPRDLNIFERIWLAIIGIFSHQPETDLTDEFGRELLNGVSINFATDHRRPNFELTHHDAVMEKAVDSEVPLYVNNLEKFGFSYRSVTATDAQAGQIASTDLPKAQDVQYAVPMNIRKMLGGESGAVYGFLSTTPGVVNKDEHDYRLFAEVTPYQMHVKLGHFSTLVWISDLQSGQPVEGAKVTIYKDALTTMGKPTDILATAVSGKDGIAILPGTAKLDPELELSSKWKDEETRLFVRVDKAKDMAVMPISSEFLIDMYRASGETVYYHNRKQYGHMRAWGTTAQGIYRAGDTIQYKFYVRAQDDNTLIPAPKDGYTLKIIDPTGKKAHQVKGVKLNEFGAYSGEFTVGEHAAVGWYQFKLVANFNKKPGDKDEDKDDEAQTQDAGNEVAGESEGQPDEPESGSGKITLMPMRVLVSDFTPVPFKVTSELNGDLFHTDQNVEVATAAKLHSGGAYTQASARVTALLNNSAFVSKDPVAKAFIFDTTKQDRGERQIFQKIEPLTDKGELKTDFTIPKQDIIYGRLTVESAVQDDRGKYVASQSQADYIAVDRLVGMRQTEWLYKAKEPAKIDYMVVDERGVPAKGSKVDLLVEKQITKSARVKGAGNAYLTNFTTEWKEFGKCDGTSDEAPQTCSFTPDEAGIYRVTAHIKDTKGNGHSSQTSLWVVGSEFVMWNDESDTALQMVPEKATYNVGDTAHYLIKNPYPGAKALITVERYGIIDHFVQTLDGSTPVISIPVKPDYLPGFYLSVVVLSPRVEKPMEDGQVDLGKPAFRMGYIAVPVKDPYKEMLVTAKTDRDVYKPRDKVKLTLHAEPKHADKKEPIEIAVAVLDESVFDLIAGGKSYYDPYAGFYSLESLDLRNYSLLTRLIGRQKFEKKGANPGGDGGSDLSMRSLFKFVSYWNPGVKADKNGNATAEFEVPDNLTGWRILAIATTPTDRVGLGDANFKVNRPTEVRPVMPNQVSESDHFNAGFSVMNRTDKPREIKVKIDADGTMDKAVHHEETVKLGAYKRAVVYVPLVAGRVDAKRDVAHGDIHFTIEASDASDGDGMEYTLPVNKMRSLETAANYGTITGDKAEESIAFPDKIHTDVGSVSVVVAPSVIGNVVGAFKYLRDYPYFCWEQILTKGVMASHYKNLRAYLPDSFTWKEADGMPESMLKSAASFQAPNGGMCYFIADDRYADPYLSAYTALAFNWLRHSGYTIPESVENKLHGYLLDYLKRDAAPEFYSQGMNSTVRAVALAALAENKKVDKSDIDRYRQHVKEMSLFGKTHFLLAAMLVGGEDEAVDETAKAILAHANETGGKFVFSEELDDSYSRILSSPMRENCAILDVFTHLGETEKGKDLVNDLPFKLVRTITQTRGGRDYWQNTQENMFCMNALIDYSRIYEKVKPAMKVTASMDDKAFGKTEFKDLRDKSATFERPIEDGDAGRKAKVAIDKSGDGRLYYATRLAYAPMSDFANPTNAGIEVHREYSVERNKEWVLLKNPQKIQRGELVRVDIYLSLAAPRNFVVVDDPVPGGLEPVNRDLANTSMVDANKGEFAAAGGSWFLKFSDWRSYNSSRWSFYHQELRHDSVRFYSDYLPAGNYHLSYTAQAIAEGQFATMPEMAQEMYDPDVYGKGVLEQLVVKAPEEPKAEERSTARETEKK